MGDRLQWEPQFRLPVRWQGLEGRGIRMPSEFESAGGPAGTDGMFLMRADNVSSVPDASSRCVGVDFTSARTREDGCEKSTGRAWQA